MATFLQSICVTPCEGEAGEALTREQQAAMLPAWRQAPESAVAPRALNAEQITSMTKGPLGHSLMIF